MGMENDLSRAIEFSRAFDRRRVEHIIPTPRGEVLLTPSVALVHHRNHFSVNLGVEACADELIAEADPIFVEHGIPHRKITIDDDLGERVAPRFRELGWHVEELLLMVHGGSRPKVDTSRAQEVDPSELEPLWIRGIRTEITDDEEVRQLVAAQHERRDGAKVRYFAARVDGEIASYCELFLDPGIGQIESVMTLERFRGRGLATAAVGRALEESLDAGSEVTFLLTSVDNPEAQGLYGKLGFETVGRMWDMTINRTEMESAQRTASSCSTGPHGAEPLPGRSSAFQHSCAPSPSRPASNRRPARHLALS